MTKIDQKRAARLKQARETDPRGFSKPIDAARYFNWSISTYLGCENGTTTFSSRKSDEFAKAYKVSRNWLWHGEGMMRASTEVDADLLQVTGYVDAGLAELFIDQSDSQIESEFLPYKDGFKYIGFRVRGPSMRPRFLEGEVLVFKPAENHKELINREVYITLTNGARLIKILKNNPNGGYLLVSHNPAFEDIEIQESDIIETRGFKGIA